MDGYQATSFLYTAANGLNLNANAFGLGGTLTSNVNLAIGTSSAFFINSTSGFVGIGTTSPREALEVSGNIAAQKFTDLDNYAYYFLDLANASPTSSSLSLERSGSINFNSNYNVGATNWQYIQNGTASKIQSIYDPLNSNGGLFLAVATIGTSGNNIGTSWDSGLFISGKANNLSLIHI